MRQEEAETDIQRYQWRLNACIRRIDEASFAAEDKLLIKGYLKHMGAQ